MRNPWTAQWCEWGRYMWPFPTSIFSRRKTISLDFFGGIKSSCLRLDLTISLIDSYIENYNLEINIPLISNTCRLNLILVLERSTRSAPSTGESDSTIPYSHIPHAARPQLFKPHQFQSGAGGGAGIPYPLFGKCSAMCSFVKHLYLFIVFHTYIFQ